ncbi:MAG: hypothetical protein RL595_1158 [Planctomycetota bacterium]|jgi:hypothetical protein
MNVPFTDVPQNIREFHQVFEQLSGSRFTLDFCRMDAWRQFINYRRDEPYTHDDLRLVWRFLKRQVLNGKRNAGALKFRNLIQNPDYFEEDLAEARGEAERLSKPAMPQRKVVVYNNTSRVVENTGEEPEVKDMAAFFANLRAQLNR